jgi:NADPH2:quinone reductase
MGAGGPGFLRQQWDELVPLMESGAIDPPIGVVRDLDEVGAAIADLEERRATGKILLRLSH